jgi:hypothetical protein
MGAKAIPRACCPENAMTQVAPPAVAEELPPLYSSGVQLDPAHVGRLVSSIDLLHDADALRARMETDGYLYIPGLLHRPAVLEARAEVARRLAAQGLLKPGTDPLDAILAPGKGTNFYPDVAARNHQLEKVIYDGPLMDFFRTLLGGPVRHFDFTWFRTVAPGRGTPAHMDSVYMNRGTHQLYTAWVPLGDVRFTLGGLIVLEGSNTNRRLVETYGMQDVDSFCSNKPDAKGWGKSWGTNGWLKANVNQLRHSITGENGRWLTNEYQAGDALIFSIFTVHASLDNHHPDRIRFSSDSRYQLASEAADERWIGEHPVGHGAAGKRGKVC